MCDCGLGGRAKFIKWVMLCCPRRPFGFCILAISASASSSTSRYDALLFDLCFGFAAWVLRGAALRVEELARTPPLVFEKKAWVVETDGAVEEAPGICFGLEAVFESAGGWDDIAVAG